MPRINGVIMEVLWTHYGLISKQGQKIPLVGTNIWYNKTGYKDQFSLGRLSMCNISIFFEIPIEKRSFLALPRVRFYLIIKPYLCISGYLVIERIRRNMVFQ